jgi:hypothetical protein
VVPVQEISAPASAQNKIFFSSPYTMHYLNYFVPALSPSPSKLVPKKAVLGRLSLGVCLRVPLPTTEQASYCFALYFLQYTVLLRPVGFLKDGNFQIFLVMFEFYLYWDVKAYIFTVFALWYQY